MICFEYVSVCGWRQEVLGCTPGKGFYREGAFCSAVATDLDNLVHTVTVVAIVRDEGLRDRRGQWG